MKKTVIAFAVAFVVLFPLCIDLLWSHVVMPDLEISTPQQVTWTMIFLVGFAVVMAAATNVEEKLPYVVDPRPDTGLTNGKLAIWLFLASEVMLFGALFSSYVLLRVGAAEWPSGEANPLNWQIATVNTVVLIASSVTMVLAWAALMAKNLTKYRLAMGATIFFGVVFLIIKAIEYGDKFHHEHFPSSSTFYAIYFTLTGLHGLHVIGGMIANAYLLGPGSKMWQTEPERFAGRVEIAGIYWHFVDLVWIFLFPVLYLL